MTNIFQKEILDISANQVSVTHGFEQVILGNWSVMTAFSDFFALGSTNKLP
jgi:hypothetical protein